MERIERVALAVLAACVLLWLVGVAHAAPEDLCGVTESPAITVSWRVPAGDPTSYTLYWSPLSGHWTDADAATQHALSVPAPLASPGARIEARFIGTTPRTQPVYLVLTASNAGGESSISNELTVPASYRPCADPVPPPPRAPTELRLQSLTIERNGESITITAEELEAWLRSQNP